MSDDAHGTTPHLEPIAYATPDPDAGETNARNFATAALSCSAAVIAVPILILFFGDYLDAGFEQLLCLTCVIVLPCLAICLGFVAKAQVGGSRGPMRRRATTAIWFGAVELGLVLAGMVLLPSIGRSRPSANRVKSASNLRQIGQALVLYGNEYGVYPPDFETLQINEHLTARVFVNPNSNDTAATGATWVAQAKGLTAQPGHCSYIYAAPSAATQPANPDRIDAYEIPVDPSGANFLFGDAHVEWIANPEAQRLIAELKAGYNPPRAATAKIPK